MSKPIDPLDAFLKTPKMSEIEKRQLTESKAREKARKARIRAGKRKTPPTTQQILDDVVRVADDKETNPRGWITRSISRGRYDEFGFYPVDLLDQFGTWVHVKEAAGLREKQGSQVWRNRRAKQSRDEHSQRLWDKTVAPFVAKREDWSGAATKPYVLMSISDLHSLYLDPFVFASFLQAVKDIKPDGICIAGDLLEGSSISSHAKIPGHVLPLQLELDFAKDVVRLCREALGHGDLFLVGGNHDIDRLVRHLAHVAPELAGLDCLRADKLLGLAEYDVTLVVGGGPLSPDSQKGTHPSLILFDHFKLTHGTRLGKFPAMDELRDSGFSGLSGHVHRPAVAFGTTDATEGCCWMSLPMAARHEVGGYIKSSNTGWCRGFGISHLGIDGGAHQYPCIVQVSRGGIERITCEGFTYTRDKKATDPGITENWLAGWSVAG